MTFHAFPSWTEVVSGKYGKIIVNPGDAYVGKALLAYGEFSDGEVDVFSALIEPGQTVLEIGSNIGALTLPIARLVGDHGVVVAVEPQRYCHQMLCGSLALNSITNTRAIWAACGDHLRTFIHIPRYEPTQPNNFGGVDIREDVPSGELVWCPTVVDLLHTLDLQGRVDFLKIDVEGMEPAVLRGAESLFSTSRPIVYAECDRPSEEPAMRAFFEQWQYDVWWHMPPMFRPDNFFKNAENIWGSTVVSVNMLCVPRERAYEPPKAWGCVPVSAGSPHQP